MSHSIIGSRLLTVLGLAGLITLSVMQQYSAPIDKTMKDAFTTIVSSNTTFNSSLNGILYNDVWNRTVKVFDADEKFKITMVAYGGIAFLTLLSYKLRANAQMRFHEIVSRITESKNWANKVVIGIHKPYVVPLSSLIQDSDRKTIVSTANVTRLTAIHE